MDSIVLVNGVIHATAVICPLDTTIIMDNGIGVPSNIIHELRVPSLKKKKLKTSGLGVRLAVYSMSAFVILVARPVCSKVKHIVKCQGLLESTGT